MLRLITFFRALRSMGKPTNHWLPIGLLVLLGPQFIGWVGLSASAWDRHLAPCMRKINCPLKRMGLQRLVMERVRTRMNFSRLAWLIPHDSFLHGGFGNWRAGARLVRFPPSDQRLINNKISDLCRVHVDLELILSLFCPAWRIGRNYVATRLLSSCSECVG